MYDARVQPYTSFYTTSRKCVTTLYPSGMRKSGTRRRASSSCHLQFDVAATSGLLGKPAQVCLPACLPPSFVPSISPSSFYQPFLVSSLIARSRSVSTQALDAHGSVRLARYPCFEPPLDTRTVVFVLLTYTYNGRVIRGRTIRHQVLAGQAPCCA